MVVFFGAVLPRYDVDFKTVVDSAVLFEELGFSSLWVTDHLQPRRAAKILESWTLLSALAPLTDARLGTVVLCSCYRHPSLLAKMAATLDVISNGRLELGVGTGSEPQAEELKALGMDDWPSEEKIERFSEYVKVLRLLMEYPGSAHFEGKFYKLMKAVCNTPPVQRPSPPIWVGARKRRMIRTAAVLGDGWNFYGETLEEYRHAAMQYQAFVRELGKKPVQSLFTNVLIYSDDADKMEKLKRFGEFTSEEQALRKTFTILHGTPDKVLKMVEELHALGAGLIVLRDVDVESSSIKAFAREIMPSFV